MTLSAVAIIVSMVFCSMSFAALNCTVANKKSVCNRNVVMERVDWACKLLEEKGRVAIPEIKKMRYDCCGDENYVWINDLNHRMIMHPIKPQLNGKELAKVKDSDGTYLFIDFVIAVNRTPSGEWVDYLWQKTGAYDSTPKTSWVRKCRVGDTGISWVVGSGTWK